MGRLSGGGRGSGRGTKRYTPRSAPPPIIPEEGEEAIYREVALVTPETYDDDIFSRLSDGRLSFRLSQRPVEGAREVDIQIDNTGESSSGIRLDPDWHLLFTAK